MSSTDHANACQDADCGLFALARSAELKPAPQVASPPLDPDAEWTDDAPLYDARRQIYPQRVSGT
jgi:hypothetical protein